LGSFHFGFIVNFNLKLAAMVANQSGSEGLRQRKKNTSDGPSDIITISEEGKKLDQKLDQHGS
jgi:hypothetical protein